MGARIPCVQDPSTVTSPDALARDERRGGEGATCTLAPQLSAGERFEDDKPPWVECGDVDGVVSDQGGRTDASGNLNIPQRLPTLRVPGQCPAAPGSQMNRLACVHRGGCRFAGKL